MNVLAINGSPRLEGNTAQLIQEVFGPLDEAGIGTELIQVGGETMHGCTACSQCFANEDQRCVIDDDPFNEIFQKMIDADGIILGSPTYFSDVTPEMKALIDRSGFVAIGNHRLLRRKVGAAVVAVRRGGAVHAFDTINHLFQMSQMMVVGSTYWNFGMGLEPGDVQDDEEGLNNMKDLGENMAWLLEQIHS